MLRLEDELKELDQRRSPVLDQQEREHLIRLGADMEIAWSHPAATMATRNEARPDCAARDRGCGSRMVLSKALHWQGGDQTALKIKKNGVANIAGRWRKTSRFLFDELARLMPDRTTAPV